MKPEQQQIAIAEACGWKYHKNVTHAPDKAFWWSKNPEFPDYCNDLNAMHEAEKVLPHQLSHIDYWQKGYGRFQTLLAELTITPYSATAAQRAEAFLKTLGLWDNN